MLGDRYRLDERVAAGGMGDVWRGTDTVLSRTVAVKVLLPAFVADSGFGARFRAEARTLAALRHPGVVDVFDYGETTAPGGGDIAYLVMAYIDGVPLTRRIADEGRLGSGETMDIVARAAKALQAAHENGIVHRDVKPGNLLVRADGSVVLVDFGIARSSAATTLTSGGSVIGTALYMAPEQAAGHTVTPAVDVYALGVVAYTCLAGHPPFTGENPIEIALRHTHDDVPPLPDDVPPAAAAVVATAMAKQPEDRYPSAAALASAARAAAAGATDHVPPPGPVPAVAPATPSMSNQTTAVLPARRRPRLGRKSALAGAGVVAALGVLALVALLGTTSKNPPGVSPAGTPTSATAPAGTLAPAGGGTGPAQGSSRPPSSSPTKGSASQPPNTSGPTPTVPPATGGPASPPASAPPPATSAPPLVTSSPQPLSSPTPAAMSVTPLAAR